MMSGTSPVPSVQRSWRSTVLQGAVVAVALSIPAVMLVRFVVQTGKGIRAFVKDPVGFSVDSFCSDPIFGFVFCGSQRVDDTKAPQVVVNLLEKHAMLSEVIELVSTSSYRPDVRTFFDARPGRFRYLGSERRETALVDGFMILDNPSLVGLSLFFVEGDGKERLYLVNLVLSPLAKQKISTLMAHTLDSIDAGYPKHQLIQARRPSKLHFLGLVPFDGTRVIKVMVREDTLRDSAIYSLNYAISRP